MFEKRKWLKSFKYGMVFSGLGVLAACGEEEAAQAPVETPVAEAPAVEEVTPSEEALAAEDTAPAMYSDALSPEANELLADVINGQHRSEKEKARDTSRHPFETLAFFGVEPGMTVAELWPGAGWYTEILAPYARRGKGTYFAAHWDPSGGSEFVTAGLDRYKKRFGDEFIYGDFVISALSGTTESIAPDGSVDVALSFRSVHNWMGSDSQDAIVAQVYKALKPGGIFGIVEHRATTDEPQDPKARSGYVREDFTIELVEKAGFKFVGASEVNANPKDTKDHPFGVWTLPPTLSTQNFGEPKNENFDSSPYVAIGESDRYTLKFMKPAE